MASINTHIPKILHQTFYRRDLPPRVAANVAGMRARNADWEYRFYDDADSADFIRTKCSPRVFDQFNRINPEYGAARADIFRYLLMYEYGGVYLTSRAPRPGPSTTYCNLPTVICCRNGDALPGIRVARDCIRNCMSSPAASFSNGTSSPRRDIRSSTRSSNGCCATSIATTRACTMSALPAFCA